MAECVEARNLHGLIRRSVRECLEMWLLQAQAGPVTPEALEGILARSAVVLLQRLEEQPPELIVELLPSLTRTMLVAFVEVMAELWRARPKVR
jgi:hypothetical protein